MSEIQKSKYKVGEMIVLSGIRYRVTQVLLFGNFYIYDLLDLYAHELHGVDLDDVIESENGKKP